MAEPAKQYSTVEEIDLSENAVYIVKDGELKQLPKPETGHGTHIINWQGNKPCHGKMELNLKF